VDLSEPPQERNSMPEKYFKLMVFFPSLRVEAFSENLWSYALYLFEMPVEV
jgi:hypothetical protein